MIHYSVSLIGNPRDPSKPKKALARAQLNKSYTVHEFAEHIANHNSKYDRGDIYAVLETVARHLRELLQHGNKVSLGSLGSFYPSLNSDCANSIAEFSNDNIRGLRAIWEMPKQFADMKEGATFCKVITREMNNKALHLEQEGGREAFLQHLTQLVESDKENRQRIAEQQAAATEPQPADAVQSATLHHSSTVQPTAKAITPATLSTIAGTATESDSENK